MNTSSATAISHPNIAFIKYSGEKLGRTDRKVVLGQGISLAEVLLSGKTVTAQIA